jgi:hypothetical protein
VRIAARFAQKCDEKAAIERAHVAYTNPRFCQQIGRDPPS